MQWERNSWAHLWATHTLESLKGAVENVWIENENVKYPNWLDKAKAIFRGKFIALGNVKKNNKDQIHNLSFHTKKPGKQK